MECSIEILRTQNVLAIVKISRTTLWRWVRSGDFPAPLRLGKRAVGWSRQSVEAWLESRRPA